MEQGKDVRDNAPSIAPFAGGDETVRFRRDTGISSWKTFSKLRRRIRFAVRLCPLSALFGTPVCNLTFLNFCISYRFVFLEERTAVACFSFVYRLHLVCFVKGNSLFPFFRGCPSPLSATPTFPHTVGNHPRQAEPA